MATIYLYTAIGRSVKAATEATYPLVAGDTILCWLLLPPFLRRPVVQCSPERAKDRPMRIFTTCNVASRRSITSKLRASARARSESCEAFSRDREFLFFFLSALEIRCCKWIYQSENGSCCPIFFGGIVEYTEFVENYCFGWLQKRNLVGDESRILRRGLILRRREKKKMSRLYCSELLWIRNALLRRECISRLFATLRHSKHDFTAETCFSLKNRISFPLEIINISTL